MPERIAIERWGETGPILLCLHGLGGSTEFFASLGPALTPTCRVVAFDFPGSGRTATPADLSFDALASVVVDVTRTLAAPVHLLGHSMGTIIGLEAIRQAPLLFSGFLAANGLPEPRADSRDRIAARLTTIASTHTLAGLGQSVAEANLSNHTRQSSPELVRRVARLLEQQPLDGYVSTARALIGWRARALPPLDHLKCGCITGAEDRYAPPADVHAFAAAMPAANVDVLPRCAHLPFLEDPSALAELVTRFLA